MSRSGEIHLSAVTVGLSYVVGALMVLPVPVIAVGAFLTGDVTNHQVDSSLIAATPQTYGDTGTSFHQLAVVMVWLYIIGWSTYGVEAAATFAPEFKDTQNDTRKAIVSVGMLNIAMAVLLPVAVLGTIGHDALAGDPLGVPYLVDVLHEIAGDTLGTFLTVCLCAGLLLSMNTATMDGSRALYALAKEKMTIKQLGVLNRFHVPARAMTVDLVLNIFLLVYFGNIFFILATGNLGYILAHVLALTGVLLLRRDRPDWPRPIRHPRGWLIAAAALAAVNALLIVFGLAFMDYTGYLWNSEFTDAWAKLPAMLIVSVGSLALGVAGYVIAQHQWGRPFRLTDPSDESPSAEATDAARPLR